MFISYHISGEQKLYTYYYVEPFSVVMYFSSCIDVKMRTCTPDTPGICHSKALCTPVTPYVCSATRPISYRCECIQGYTGDGFDCTGELKLAAETIIYM